MVDDISVVGSINVVKILCFSKLAALNSPINVL